MNKKADKPKQRFVNKNLVPLSKATKKDKAIFLKPSGKKQIEEIVSDGSANTFNATENMRYDD